MRDRLNSLAKSILSNSQLLANLSVAWAEIGKEMAGLAEDMREDGVETNEGILDSIDGNNPEHVSYLVEVMKRFPNSKGGVDSKRYLKAMAAGQFPHPPLKS